jgi:predicted hydrocarbon binding protein
MVDVEFRVVSDRREGLLLALGQAVIASGFTLLRQRMAGDSAGVVLTMLVRGPPAHLLALEECLGTHPLVRSFEATRPDGTPDRVEAPPEVADAFSPIRTNTLPSLADSRLIEAMLPQLAHDYPNIFVPLLALERQLTADQREPALRYVGQRVGAWVYKRDFALGAHLPIADAVRHIALPAMRQIVQAEMHHDALHVSNSPFCHRGGHGACCHFLRGMLGGLLGATYGADGLRVVETQCRNTGAEICSFEFRD